MGSIGNSLSGPWRAIKNLCGFYDGKAQKECHARRSICAAIDSAPTDPVAPASALSAALDHFPDFEGVVFRSTSIFEPEIRKLWTTQGNIISDPAFLSELSDDLEVP